MNWRKLVGSILLVSTFAVGCGSVEDENKQQEFSEAELAAAVEKVTEAQATEWQFRNAASGGSGGLNPGVALGMFDSYDGSYLKYSERNFGINLGWTRSFLSNVTLARQDTRDHRSIKSGEPIALRINGGGYVKYQRRDWGINLAWSSTPVYEWELRSNTLGQALAMNQKVRLFNRTANDNVVYCWRPHPVVNLAWNGDCYNIGGRRAYRPELP